MPSENFSEVWEVDCDFLNFGDFFFIMVQLQKFLWKNAFKKMPLQFLFRSLNGVTKIISKEKNISENVEALMSEEVPYDIGKLILKKKV